MKLPHPIPYQGSKRNLAKYILPFFPCAINTLVEPFAGSAAISIAAAYYRKASRFYLNDINVPLMNLWKWIVTQPEQTANAYKRLWIEQTGNERDYYDFVRDEFNKTQNPEYLLYLLARCVKASVRYNTKGEFNQSPDNRRRGRHPTQMREDILATSRLFDGKNIITSLDYKKALSTVTLGDLVYMDPPYQGVCVTGDPRYYQGIEFEEFMRALERLTSRGIPFILSYDGRTGQKVYGAELPKELGMYRLEINAGRSTQSTLLGGNDITYESVYLSRGLVSTIGITKADLPDYNKRHQEVQLSFL